MAECRSVALFPIDQARAHTSYIAYRRLLCYAKEGFRKSVPTGEVVVGDAAITPQHVVERSEFGMG